MEISIRIGIEIEIGPGSEDSDLRLGSGLRLQIHALNGTEHAVMHGYAYDYGMY